MTIVEITREHLSDLIHRGHVELDGVTVRVGATAGVLEQRVPAASRTEQVTERRQDARAQLTGDPQFYMPAKYDGVCPAQRTGPAAPDCTVTIATFDQVLRDAANKKTYCAPCGAMKYPNVRIPVR